MSAENKRSANSGFEFFSRITSIRKDSKNENSTHSSLLESEVLFLFFYCRRQRYSRNRYYQNEVLAKVFRAPFFKKVRYYGSTMRAVLHNTSENGEGEAAYGAHPEPYFGEEEVGARDVDTAVDLIFWH